MIEKQVDVLTSDGLMSTFVCHPERGGPHSVILFFMDAPGIREELRDMVRRLAATGYYVLLPNLYYRVRKEEFDYSDGITAEIREKFVECMTTLRINSVVDDAGSLIAYAKQDGAANAKSIGCVGYCMSGQFVINTAARFNDDIKAVASIYGVKLVTEDATSPHLVACNAKAEFYLACADNDVHVPLSMVEQFKRAVKADEVKSEVEIYPGTEHGFAFPQRPVYKRESAERHWERILDLFKRCL
jgi:carboxymethylenebutenolidase